MDARRVKSEQRRVWDAIAAARSKWLGVFEPALAPVSEQLLDLAAVTPGKWVLDVGCGLGDTALAAARRVGPDGRVVGIDLSKRQLQIAEARARAAGLANVGFKEQDVEDLGGWPEAGYEAAVARFALSFLPQLDVALRGIHRVLTRGSALAAAVWGEVDKMPFMAVPRAAIAEFVGRALPSPDEPGAFALGRPGLLEQALSSAGFAKIRGERTTVVIEVASAAAYVELLRESSSIGELVAENATVGVDEVWKAVAAAAAPYADETGKLSFVCHATLVVGTKA